MARLARRPSAAFARWIVAAGFLSTGCAIHGSEGRDPSRLPWLEPVPAANGVSTSTKSRPTGQDVLPVNYQRPDNESGPRPTSNQSLPPPKEVTPSKPATPSTTVDGLAARLKLDEVINAVLVSDPKLRAGFEAINQAHADALTVSLRPNPTLFTDAQLLPLTRPFTPTRQGGPPQQDAQVTYPIDWWLFGKRAAAMAAAAHGVKVSEADFADQIRQRVSDAATGFYDVLEAKAILALARQDVTTLENAEAATAKAVAAGGRTQIELGRLRLDLARSRQLVRDAETTLVSAKAKLRAMIGRADSDPVFDVEGSLDAPLDVVLPPADEGFEKALRNRPDIQSYRWKSAQARANVVSETRKAYPEVAPMFGYTRQYQQKAIGFPDANSWTAAVSVSLPFFDRNQGNRAKAASVIAQREYEYQAALADLRAEIESASQEFRAARANAAGMAAEQLKVAREVLDSIAAAYQVGGRPLLELFDAQRNYRDTYRAYITSRANYWRSVYRYRAVIGQQGLK